MDDSATAGEGASEPTEKRVDRGVSNREDRGVSGRDDHGLTTVEQWRPPSSALCARSAVGEYLGAGESLQVIDEVSRPDDGGTPAAVGLTGRRLLVVSPDGSFLDVGLDRVCSVRSDRQSYLGVRGNDYRLVLCVGYLFAIVGLVGVLATSTSALTPTVALTTVGGVLLTDHVYRAGVDLDGPIGALDRGGRAAATTDRLRRWKRRLNGHVTDDDLALGATGGFTAGTFLLVVTVEPGLLAPALTLATVVGCVLSVYAFRYSDAFDGIELVRRRQRTVRVTVEDGQVVTLCTNPESTLDRELARLAHGRSPRPAVD
ncbi:hypothetical protein BRC64_02265 [Halobacteriales archaeon QH_10_67_22]|nr:MAG: hypothetical protein BRC64_02265 [Halobacteriales archaeon QH_10_67_22]